MPGKSEPFIHLPEYPGGMKALNKFISENIRLPEEAVKQRIKGVVQLEVSIDYKGNVKDVQVIHSLGFGCDEEAIRIARMLRFLESFNKGLKVSRTLKLRVPFNAGGVVETTLAYTYTETSAKPAKEPAAPQEQSGYGYTIQFNS